MIPLKISYLAPLLIALLLASAAAGMGSPDELFNQGNLAYGEEQYEAAADKYQQAINEGNYSADLFYNLANAFVRLDQPGRALLNYERALILDPYHQEARLNSNFVKSGLPQIEPELSAWESFFGIWPASAYITLLCVAGWMTLALLMIGLLTRFSTVVVSLVILAALSLGLGTAGYLVTRPFEVGPQSAMVTGSAAKAHYAPAASSATVTPLPAGTKVKILNSMTGWNYIKLPDNRLGWVESEKLERLLPEHDTAS